MTLSYARRLVVFAFIIGAGAEDGLAAQAPQQFSWWRSEQFKKELGLTVDQIGRIDKIFQGTRPELIQEMEELNKSDSKLQKLLETSTDEALIARQIDRVETARANLNKTRALMIARMRLVLNAEQRVRFMALYEQRMNQNRRSGDQPRTPPDGAAPKHPDAAKRPGC